jgi:hypothetical protein
MQTNKKVQKAQLKMGEKVAVKQNLINFQGNTNRNHSEKLS